MEDSDITKGLALLRAPFPPNQIGKLPKPTRKQTDDVKKDFKRGIRCKDCGAWHHPEVAHLDYVGHAALTDRLLDADPSWTWEPMALTEDKLPKFNSDGGLWIRLTVCSVTRLGYGNAPTKNNADPGSREKEVIGDALRNAAMRFGAALDLWHKGDLHTDEGPADMEKAHEGPTGQPSGPTTDEQFAEAGKALRAVSSLDELLNWRAKYGDLPRAVKDELAAEHNQKSRSYEP